MPVSFTLMKTLVIANSGFGFRTRRNEAINQFIKFHQDIRNTYSMLCSLVFLSVLSALVVKIYLITIIFFTDTFSPDSIL